MYQKTLTINWSLTLNYAVTYFTVYFEETFPNYPIYERTYIHTYEQFLARREVRLIDPLQKHIRVNANLHPKYGGSSASIL